MSPDGPDQKVGGETKVEGDGGRVGETISV